MMMLTAPGPRLLSWWWWWVPQHLRPSLAARCMLPGTALPAGEHGGGGMRQVAGRARVQEAAGVAAGKRCGGIDAW